MKACRTASIVASLPLGVLWTIGACRHEARVDVPAVTTASPSKEPVLSTSIAKASPPIAVDFVTLPLTVEAKCREVAIALVGGAATALGETLNAGDVIVVTQSEPIEIKGTGTAVRAIGPVHDACGHAKKVIRTTPELAWANGAMRARLQVGDKDASFYLGRLEGTAPVAEHVHEATWEILATIDAAGVLTVAGTDTHVGPRQVIAVPPDTPHAWKPDPGGKLSMVQIYSSHGPEQRFVALAAAANDAGR